jgi:hypothetical protein
MRSVSAVGAHGRRPVTLRHPNDDPKRSSLSVAVREALQPIPSDSAVIAGVAAFPVNPLLVHVGVEEDGKSRRDGVSGPRLIG